MSVFFYGCPQHIYNRNIPFKSKYNYLVMRSVGFRSTSLSNFTEPICLFIFFLRQSSKMNWQCYNEELRLNYPLNPALHIAFVTTRFLFFSNFSKHYHT